MFTTIQECQDTRRRYADMRQTMGRRNARRQLLEEINTLGEAGYLREQWGMLNIFEAFAESEPGANDGEEIVREQMRHKRSHGYYAPLRELVGGAMQVSDFTDIIGQITYSEVLQRFEGTDYIMDGLSTRRPSSTKYRREVPGVAPPGDVSKIVGEGQPYPKVVFGTDRETEPQKYKRGYEVEVTEELIFEEKTGEVMDMLDTGTAMMAIQHEKEGLDVAFGHINNYRRNDVDIITYANNHPQGDFNNLIVNNPLVNFDSLTPIINLLMEQLDPNINEPIMVSDDLTLLVPHQLWNQAVEATQATVIEEGQRGSGVFVSQFTNPLTQRKQTFRLETSPYVNLRSPGPTTYYAGDFRKAIRYHETWPLIVDRFEGTEMQRRDILMAMRVRRLGAYHMFQPRYLVKITGTP